MTLDEAKTIATIISPIATLIAVSVAFYFQNETKKNTTRNQLESQAKQVTGWLAGSHDEIKIDVWESESSQQMINFVILNSSQSAIYKLIARVTRLNEMNEGPFEEDSIRFFRCIGIVPPGKFYSTIEYPGAGMSKQYNIELVFQDSNNTNWIRYANGVLKKIDKTPTDYYNLSLPRSWGGELKAIK